MIKINYKYLNLLLLLGNCYLLFLLRNIWVGAVLKLFNILLPFILSFSLAYLFYPLVKIFNKRLPRVFSIIVVLIIIIITIALTLYFTLPILFSGIINFINIIQKNIILIGDKYNIDYISALNFIKEHSSKIIDMLNIAENTNLLINTIVKSVKYITFIIMVFVLFLYFLFNMENIRKQVKRFLKEKKIFFIIKNIDKELTSYLKGFFIFMFVQFIEYTLVFLLIGHPNYLLIGFLASITGFIPYLGAIMANTVAFIIALNVSKRLFILTCIVLIIFPNIDEYIITPKIYSRTNKITPIFQIFSLFLFGNLFGFIGIVISMPLTIIFAVLFREYKYNILMKIRNLKEKT